MHSVLKREPSEDQREHVIHKFSRLVSVCDEEFYSILAGMFYYNTVNIKNYIKGIRTVLNQHLGSRTFAISTPKRLIKAQSCVRPRAILYVLDEHTGESWVLIKFFCGKLLILERPMQHEFSVQENPFDISDAHVNARLRNMHPCLC